MASEKFMTIMRKMTQHILPTWSRQEARFKLGNSRNYEKAVGKQKYEKAAMQTSYTNPLDAFLTSVLLLKMLNSKPGRRNGSWAAFRFDRNKYKWPSGCDCFLSNL